MNSEGIQLLYAYYLLENPCLYVMQRKAADIYILKKCQGKVCIPQVGNWALCSEDFL